MSADPQPPSTESPTEYQHPKRKRNFLDYLFDAFRGFLIGLAELVPGISGGTVALIVGIYEKALHNADLLMRRKFREIDWLFLCLVGGGMVLAIFTMSTVMHNFVTNYPEMSNGLFLGMVAVSIIVPIGMMNRRTATWKLLFLFIPGVIVGFVATGFTSGVVENPTLIAIFFAAMVAVCALMIPGLSGSFVLLALGLYQPIMGSLSDREWDVIIVFILGALTGVVAFVRVLSWLLEKHRNVTLALMAGLMVGSLRALWPWPDSEPTNVGPVVAMMVLGALIVAAFLAVDRFKQSKTPSAEVSASDPS
ncbi:DUF368 domain-containing protein [Corynebacterium lubricantis]|uniref:DUF368 domain-containing protein n=1 Tax=Corynebacterium lubricantis TaxID=541095 RepID=UPI00036A9BE9|nr:DUF368 domain-containing protein [Corynebacterium lubricantis]